MEVVVAYLIYCNDIETVEATQSFNVEFETVGLSS
jgi:hypothetical protein